MVEPLGGQQSRVRQPQIRMTCGARRPGHPKSMSWTAPVSRTWTLRAELEVGAEG